MKFIGKLKFFLFFLVGIFLIYWVYDFFAGPESLKLIVKNKDKLFFLILAHIPTLYFTSASWFILLNSNKLSMIWAYLITWISQASGKFLPTGIVSGEFVRIYLSVKKGIKTSEASSTVFADLAVATFSLFLMAVFSFVYLFFDDKNFIGEEYISYFYWSLLLIFFSCLLFILLVRKRFIRFLLRKIFQVFRFSLRRKLVLTLLKIDFFLYKLSFKKLKVAFATLVRLLAWVCGAFEIFIFLWIIDVQANFLDLIILESFTGIVRALVFFIPAGLGIQELAFVIVGDYLGFSGPISFSVAIGRRIREVLVGVPAIISWYFLFNKKDVS